MIQVWLCDDDAVLLEKLSKQVYFSFQQRNVDANICTFETAAALLGRLDESAPDLLFIDLVLKKEDGYELAAELRRRHQECEIVFVTNYPERMADAFIYRPIGFISKPASEDQLNQVINNFLLYYWDTQAYYAVSNRDLQTNIPLKDILYFESSGHKVIIFRENRPDPVSHIRKLDDIAGELRERAFVRTHKSFLVRLGAILSIDRRSMNLQLKDGKSLPISRRYYDEVMELYIKYRLR